MNEVRHFNIIVEKLITVISWIFASFNAYLQTDQIRTFKVCEASIFSSNEPLTVHFVL